MKFTCTSIFLYFLILKMCIKPLDTIFSLKELLGSSQLTSTCRYSPKIPSEFVKQEFKASSISLFSAMRKQKQHEIELSKVVKPINANTETRNNPRRSHVNIVHICGNNIYTNFRVELEQRNPCDTEWATSAWQ